jgi:hypothetical protein
MRHRSYGGGRPTFASNIGARRGEQQSPEGRDVTVNPRSTMMNSNRSIQLARALAIGAVLATLGCNADGSLAANRGRVRLIISPEAGNGGAPNMAADVAASHSDDDGPRPWWFQSASVTLSSVLARNSDGVLVNLGAALPVVVDVMKIDGGKQVVLPDGILAVGSYDQIVLVMTAVQGVTEDGTAVTVEPPGGGWTAVIPICPLEVTDGGTATVGITLNVRNSFMRLASRWHFQPRFRSHLDCDSGEDGEEGN